MTDVISLMDRYLHACRDRDHERGARQQAEDRLAEQVLITQRAEALADDEKNRADGAEAHLHKVLVCHVIKPATGGLRGVSGGTEVPDKVMDSIAEDLIHDLDHGLAVDQLPEDARERLALAGHAKNPATEGQYHMEPEDV
jgi:hypothetical protein